jgi:hypothetical protein
MLLQRGYAGFDFFELSQAALAILDNQRVAAQASFVSLTSGPAG